MYVRDKLKETAMSTGGDRLVSEVRIGIGYTAVMLENGTAGVAYTFSKASDEGCETLKVLRPLAGRRASELLVMFDSKNRIESAIALATSNALSNNIEEGFPEGDMLEHVSFGPEDRVGMVGHFAPIVPLIRKRTSSLIIFEQIAEPKGNLLPESEAYRLLPDCHVALITSTAIINHTIDGVLEAAQTCREVVLLGASTPLISKAFADTPVTRLSGVVITRPDEIMKVVSEGGGMRSFKGCIKKVNIHLG